MRFIFLSLIFMSLSLSASPVWQVRADLEHPLYLFHEASQTSGHTYVVKPTARMSQVSETPQFYEVLIDEDISGFVLKSDVQEFIVTLTVVETLILDNTEAKWVGNELYFRVGGNTCLVISLNTIKQSKSDLRNWTVLSDYTQAIGGVSPANSRQVLNCDLD